MPLLAVLPVAAVAVPACLDFQMCAAHDVATVTFKVINTGCDSIINMYIQMQH